MTIVKTINTLLLSTIILSATYSQDITDEKIAVQKNFVSDEINANPLTGLFSSNVRPLLGNLSVSQDSLLSFAAPTVEISADIEPLAYQQAKIDEGSYGHIMATAGTLNPLALQGALYHKVDNYFSVQALASYDNWNDERVQNKHSKVFTGALNASYYVTDHSEFNISLGGSSSNLGAFSNLNTSEIQDTAIIKTFNVTMDYRTFHEDNLSLDYGLNVSYNTTSSNLISDNESLWIITPNLSKGLSQELKIRAASKNYFPSSFGTVDDLVSNNTLGFVWNKQQFTLNIGGTYNRSNNNNTLYPSLKANVYLSKDNTLSISAKEIIDFQGLGNTTAVNPFLNDTFNRPFATRVREHSLALRNKVNDRIKVSAQLSRNFYFNGINWDLSDVNRRFFGIETIDYDAWLANLRFSVEAHKLVTASTSFTKSIYNAESVLLYRPEHKLDLQATFHTVDRKFEATLSGNLNDQQITDVLATGLEVNSDYRYDLGFSVTYRPIDLLTVQLNGTNLLNNEFEVLRGYDTFSRNFSASVLLKF
jgi:hypothetical protein